MHIHNTALNHYKFKYKLISNVIIQVLKKTMSYVIIDNLDTLAPIKKYLKSDLYPIVLFDNPIKFINHVEINKEPNDKNEYIVTLYTPLYLINLDKPTDINNIVQLNEKMDFYGDFNVLNLHETNFLKGTVQLKQNTDIINEKVYYQVTPDDTKTYDSSKNSNQYPESILNEASDNSNQYPEPILNEASDNSNQYPEPILNEASDNSNQNPDPIHNDASENPDPYNNEDNSYFTPLTNV